MLPYSKYGRCCLSHRTTPIQQTFRFLVLFWQPQQLSVWQSKLAPDSVQADLSIKPSVTLHPCAEAPKQLWDLCKGFKQQENYAQE